MADRTLISLMAAGLRTKAPTGVTTLGGPLREISSVGFPREPFAGAWQRNVSAEGAGTLLSFSPIYACVTRIASDIAKLASDILLMLKDGDGIDVLAPPNSPYWTVLRKPNSYQNLIQFIRYWLLCKLIFGNAYAIKIRDGRGMVVALYLIDPRKVCPLVTPDGGVYYSIGGDQLARVPNGYAAAPSSEVIHDRGPTLWHPLVGVSPMYAAALSGTLGLAIQRNSAAFFANMSRPSGVLTAPGTIDDITADRLKREWNEKFSGVNAGKIAVLGDGLDYTALTMAAEQSQLAEQFGMTAVDIATAFSMPAYKINQGQMPTSNNVGALNQQYYSDCLQVQIEDIEACLSEGLGAIDAAYKVQFDLDGLLRTDPASLYTALGTAVKETLMTPNEGRRRINLPPKTGGDALYKQQQDYSLAALAKRDAQPDPFAKSTPATAPPTAPAQADAAAEGKRLGDIVTEQLDAGIRGASVGLQQAAGDAVKRVAEELAVTAASAVEDVKAVVAEANAATVAAAADGDKRLADALAKVDGAVHTATVALEQAAASVAQQMGEQIAAQAAAAAEQVRAVVAAAQALPAPAVEPAADEGVAVEDFAKRLLEQLEHLG